jgi:hypothetical protein
MKVFFIDTVEGFGGGQVVLAVLSSAVETKGAEAIIIRDRSLLTNARLILGTKGSRIFSGRKFRKASKPEIIVVNANQSLLHGVMLKMILRLLAKKTRVIFIAHNYPRNYLRRKVLEALTIFVHSTICVDPGLEDLFHRTVPAPLLVLPGEATTKVDESYYNPRVVSYQRADLVKGGLRLAPIFEYLSKKGFICEVALDSALDKDDTYSLNLKQQLDTWLVDGRKDQTWLNYGDIFILTSYSETAALSVQEAVYRGCFVVSSAVGILPQLTQIIPTIRIIDPWSTSSVCEQIMEISSISEKERVKVISQAQKALSNLSGTWIEFVLLHIQQNERSTQ